MVGKKLEARSLEFDLLVRKSDTLSIPDTTYFSVVGGKESGSSCKIYNLSIMLPTSASPNPLLKNKVYITGIQIIASFSRIIAPVSPLAARSMVYRMVVGGCPTYSVCNQKIVMN